jgi:hypothetical protein
VRDELLDEYPQELLQDQYRLSALVVELIHRFGDDLVIHIIDPQSLPGLLKSLRYRVRKYPAFIIDGQELVLGWDLVALTHSLSACSPSDETLLVGV